MIWHAATISQTEELDFMINYDIKYNMEQGTKEQNMRRTIVKDGIVN